MRRAGALLALLLVSAASPAQGSRPLVAGLPGTLWWPSNDQVGVPVDATPWLVGGTYISPDSRWRLLPDEGEPLAVKYERVGLSYTARTRANPPQPPIARLLPVPGLRPSTRYRVEYRRSEAEEPRVLGAFTTGPSRAASPPAPTLRSHRVVRAPATASKGIGSAAGGADWGQGVATVDFPSAGPYLVKVTLGQEYAHELVQEAGAHETRVRVIKPPDRPCLHVEVTDLQLRPLASWKDLCEAAQAEAEAEADPPPPPPGAAAAGGAPAAGAEAAKGCGGCAATRTWPVRLRLRR